VAEELKSLMQAAAQSAAGGGQQEKVPVSDSRLTWEEMEKLVLGRALTKRDTHGSRLVMGASGHGARATRLIANRQRNLRLWWIGLGSASVVLVAALVIGLLFGAAKCDPKADEVAGNLGTASTGMEAQVLPVASSTTTTTLPPTTTTELPLPEYVAELVGAEAIPAVTTDASGRLELTLSADGMTVDYVLSFEDLDSLTLARLRAGKLGETGDEIFTLYPGPTKDGLFTGVAAEGSFSAADLVGPLKGKTVAEFVAMVEEGSVYVIVGTTRHRGGELRGQLK